MMSPEMHKPNVENGIESTALDPKAGEIPTFTDKTFSDVGSDDMRLAKDSNIPRFASDNAESEYHTDGVGLPNEHDDSVSAADTPMVDNDSRLDNAIVRSCYINADGLPKNLPKSDGGWTGEPGNSTWIPDPDYVPQKGNPDGNTWGEILDKYDIDGIPFNDGEPDFSEVAEAEVQVDEIGPERDENFAKADEALAEQWTKEQKDGHEWTAEDVRNYRKENHLTWHECGDRTTMQLVPAEVHSNVPHSGGVSAAKAESGKSESAESTSATAIASDGTSNSNNVNNA